MKKWHKNYEQCVVCKLKKKPFFAKGMCALCYERNRWKTNPLLRAKHKELTYKWRSEHPERWLEIVKKAVKKYQDKNREKIRAYYRKKYHDKKRNKII